MQSGHAQEVAAQRYVELRSPNILYSKWAAFRERRFIHPAAREGDQAACAHTTRAPAPPFQRGGGLAYGLRWGMMDSDRAELGLVCEAAGWMGLVGGGGGGGRERGGEEGLPNGPHSAAAAPGGHAIPAA